MLSGGSLEKDRHGPSPEGPCRVLDINSKGNREPLMALNQRSDLVRQCRVKVCVCPTAQPSPLLSVYPGGTLAQETDYVR